MQDNNKEILKVAKDWRWLKLLIPFWVILAGIPLIIMRHPKSGTIAVVLALALMVATVLTAFCVKCYVFYVKETKRQIQELEDLQKEVNGLEEKKKSKHPAPPTNNIQIPQ